MKQRRNRCKNVPPPPSSGGVSRYSPCSALVAARAPVTKAAFCKILNMNANANCETLCKVCRETYCAVPQFLSFKISSGSSKTRQPSVAHGSKNTKLVRLLPYCVGN